MCLKNLGKAYLNRNDISTDVKHLNATNACILLFFFRIPIHMSIWQLGDHFPSCQIDWTTFFPTPDYNYIQLGDTQYPLISKAVSRHI